MNLKEYQAAQAAVVLNVLRQITPFSSYFAGVPDNRAWIDFLRVIFPFVRDARQKSADVAYEYFHSEHRRIYGTDDGWKFSPDGYQFNWFVNDMEPVREFFTKPKSDPSYDATKITQAVQRGVARATENGGRQAMKYATEAFDELEPDPPTKAIEKVEEVLTPKPKKEKKKKKDQPVIRDYKGNVVKMKPRRVKGWARVPTGAETCGWCLMLCSRGPVYSSAYTAGLEMEDYQAVKKYDKGQIVKKKDMNEWHPGCDCKVVPVFDTRDWPGKDLADEYLELWNKATELARAELERNPDKKSFVNGRWVPTTLNREAINQMRRLVGEAGYRDLKRAA